MVGRLPKLLDECLSVVGQAFDYAEYIASKVLVFAPQLLATGEWTVGATFFTHDATTIYEQREMLDRATRELHSLSELASRSASPPTSTRSRSRTRTLRGEPSRACS